MDDRRTRRTRPLDTPLPRRRGWSGWTPRVSVDPELFGYVSESFARLMGTARFLLGMTVFVVAWVLLNVLPGLPHFDEYPFIFLTLMLSLQASYAAPLILLAQSRQDSRDRILEQQDRDRDERALADTEFLTREIASLRASMQEIATRGYVKSELRAIAAAQEELRADALAEVREVSARLERIAAALQLDGSRPVG